MFPRSDRYSKVIGLMSPERGVSLGCATKLSRFVTHLTRVVGIAGSFALIPLQSISFQSIVPNSKDLMTKHISHTKCTHVTWDKRERETCLRTLTISAFLEKLWSRSDLRTRLTWLEIHRESQSRPTARISMGRNRVVPCTRQSLSANRKRCRRETHVWFFSMRDSF